MKKILFIVSASLLVIGALSVTGFKSPGTIAKEEALEKAAREILRTVQNCDLTGFSKMVFSTDDINVAILKSTIPDSIKKEMLKSGIDRNARKQQEIMNSYFEFCSKSQDTVFKKMAWRDIDYQMERENGIYIAKVKIWVGPLREERYLRIREMIWVEGKGWKIAGKLTFSSNVNRYPTQQDMGDLARQLADSIRMADSMQMVMAIEEQRLVDSILMAERSLHIADSIRIADSLARSAKKGKKPKKN